MPVLDWLNKQHALRVARAVPCRLLELRETHGDPAADNWLIQGDNLDALLPFHAGRVKCIYIDPPYNTRSAFEPYDDNLEHSQWLTMMQGTAARACVSADHVFTFGRGLYPARPPYYAGRYRFAKHYYGVIGDLKEPAPRQFDHEYHCAVALDELPAVRHWVRNLARFPEFSFWLPTASDRFYPDFVAELHDGRLLVVEYKGEGYKSSDDTIEKRRVGELWAKLSGNLFLLAVERDEHGRGVREQLLALAGRAAIEEHAVVAVVADTETEDGLIRAGALGTVVSVYDGGASYAVEFEDLADGMGVVFLAADAICKVHDA